MKKEVEEVKKQDESQKIHGKIELTEVHSEPFDLEKELDKIPVKPLLSGIEQLDEAFRRAFKYRPKKN